jgi:hypothetical protein
MLSGTANLSKSRRQVCSSAKARAESTWFQLAVSDGAPLRGAGVAGGVGGGEETGERRNIKKKGFMILNLFDGNFLIPFSNINKINTLP